METPPARGSGQGIAGRLRRRRERSLPAVAVYAGGPRAAPHAGGRAIVVAAPRRRGEEGCPGRGGFTLVELLVATAVLAVLIALVLPTLRDSVEQARVVQATGDIRTLQTEIVGYASENGQLPESLADVGRGGMEDPWGNRYRYQNLDDASPGMARKDRFLVPLNSDFDLYSVGADGDTQLALTAESAQDDVIRANDGSYIGLASRY